MATSYPCLSIVIPTFRRHSLLFRCLEALGVENQGIHPEQFEIIISDDAREVALKRKLEALSIQTRWIPGPSKGPAANRNHGASHAQGEWILFMDDDCIPQKHCLAAYYRAILKDPHLEAIEGAIISDRPQRSLIEEAPLNLTGGAFWSCNLAIRKTLFTRIGGFDEAFPYAAYEDIDFRRRLQALHIKSLFLKEAAVCHPWRSFNIWKKFLQQRQSALIYIKKHPDEWPNMGPWMTLKILIGRVLKKTLPGLIRYKGRGFFLDLLYNLLDLGFVFYLWLKKIFKRL